MVLTPYTHTVYTAGQRPDISVGVEADGWITLDGQRLAQREAIDLALLLAQAVEDSIWRNQIGTSYYGRTENILHRANAPLGQALTALRKVFR